MARDQAQLGSHGHVHSAGVDGDNERRVVWALILTAGFMVVEVIGGLLSGSLALLADAGHMLTDVIALMFAWIAFRMSRLRPDSNRSYGYHRLQILAAFVNGVTLVGVVGWIAIEAVRRLDAPIEVLGGPMLAVAAALVILASGWMAIDPILSLLVALLILRSSWQIIKKSMHILLEGTPDWLDIQELRDRLTVAVPEIEDIHHVHAWSLTTEKPLITLHARVAEGTDFARALLAVKEFLHSRYGISHSTVQIESEICADDH